MAGVVVAIGEVDRPKLLLFLFGGFVLDDCLLVVLELAFDLTGVVRALSSATIEVVI